MSFLLRILALGYLTFFCFGCSTPKIAGFKPKKVFTSDELIITQISAHTYIHTSYKQTNDFGNVPCNGLIVIEGNEVLVFDTPTQDHSAEILIQWIHEKLNSQIKAVIPTHFHDDCLGGLKAFHQHQIPSYANTKTIELARQQKSEVPQHSFQDSMEVSLGQKRVTATYLGEGHTVDNVVGYFPSENVMFGGCLIKEIDAGKGYLGDANIHSWSKTVEKVKAYFPDVKMVVPGHGDYGNQTLLDYTIQLFKTTK